MNLTEEDKTKYLKASHHCPNSDCRSTDIEGSSVEIDAGGAKQAVTCHSCGMEWTDIYTLTGIEED